MCPEILGWWFIFKDGTLKRRSGLCVHWWDWLRGWRCSAPFRREPPSVSACRFHHCAATFPGMHWSLYWSGGTLLPRISWMSSDCILTWERESVGSRVERGEAPILEGSPLMTKSPPQGPFSQYHHSGGEEFNMWTLGDTVHNTPWDKGSDMDTCWTPRALC